MSERVVHIALLVGYRSWVKGFKGRNISLQHQYTHSAFPAVHTSIRNDSCLPTQSISTTTRCCILVDAMLDAQYAVMIVKRLR